MRSLPNANRGDEINRLSVLEDLAKRNLVAAGLLVSAEATEEGSILRLKLQLNWDFTHHRTFPVLSLKR